ncbi:MAG: His/Gly/Thr/Pro-type tRNA ligase C-terminal domain-containing protein, partial [Chloroflexota bacterium]
NQWANVVRWELRTRLFLRGSEFLWQEGHTAHATAEEADAEARLILDLYVRLIEEELAIPVIAGTKTESERFAGATGTYTVESLMGDARVLQMGTSHDLGQNFSKAFDVTFLDRDGKEAFPWSTSWAVSTRLIGALVMVHGDKKGLRLPPRIAPTQVVIVPIWRNDQERSSIEPLVAEVQSELVRAGIRVHVDWRDQVRPGFKFNFWEMKGVPVRLEIGPRDAANRTVVAARRDTGEKVTMPVDGLASVVAKLLAGVQQGLFDEAKRFLDEHTSQAATWEEMERYLVEPGGLVWVNWCDSQECEQALAGLKATVRAIPLDEEARRPTGPCVCRMGHGAQFRAAVARSY